MAAIEPQGFREFVVAATPRLTRTAYLLTGDRQLAEDLLQSTLARVWPRWNTIAAEAADAYVHTVMVRLSSAWWRRRWRGEIPTAELPDRAAPSADQPDDALVLAAAMRRLPIGQRRAVALRYAADLSVEQVAAVLGCSTGTVKSQCARGLARLREILEDGDGPR